MSALIAGNDGLHDLRVIVGEASTWLGDNGMLVVEMGHTQAVAVVELFNDAGFGSVIVHRDLAGRDRFVSGVRA